MGEEISTLERVMHYPNARVLGADEAGAKVASQNVHGGLFDEGGGHLHPLNYALGLAGLARKAGVEVFERSEVKSLETQGGIIAHAENGAVRAKYGVLACDALLGGLEPRIAGRVMPVANYLIATRPISAPQDIIADDIAVSDSRFAVNYCRMSADNRLIFGGGERYSPNPPANIARFMRGHMARLFPQLRQIDIDYSWGGLVSITMSRLPHIGRMGDLFFAHGYSGQGVLLPALIGKLLSEAMSATAERFDVLAGLKAPQFPGGAALRSPLYVLAMLWYGLRDRL
jgi:gamma-glutamylputrescine oxidase